MLPPEKQSSIIKLITYFAYQVIVPLKSFYSKRGYANKPVTLSDLMIKS